MATSVAPVVSLIVPTFNESANIAELVDRADRALASVVPGYEIIVVDDSSPDGTADVVESIARANSRLRLVRRTADRDLSASVVDGWNAAGGQILAVIDGDLQHPPEKLADLIGAMVGTGADIGVASRNVSGGGVSDWAIHRRAVSWSATLLASVLLPGLLRTVSDPMSGFFAVRRERITSVCLKPKGYKILLDVLGRTSSESVVEVPYTFEERKRGQSKMGRKQMLQYLQHLASLSWDTGEFARILRYCCAGAIGVLANIGTIEMLRSTNQWIALAAGFEVSVLNNFVLNNWWTFRDRAQAGRFGSRLRLFHVISLLGLLANIGAFGILSYGFGTSRVIALVAGLILGALTNFAGNAHLTWSIWYAEPAQRFGGLLRRRRIPVSQPNGAVLLKRNATAG